MMSVPAFHVMTKPIGPICNLDCKYCFYVEKEELYPGGENFKMSDELLERYISQYIAHQSVPEIHFAWQGGEPTLLGVRFFRKVVEPKKNYANGRRIHNALQTNGTLLNDEWCEFLAENKFLVGLSIDGPARFHDAYRVTKKGGGSYFQVMAGLKLLKKHGVELNTLTVVNRKNARYPLEVYRFCARPARATCSSFPLSRGCRTPGRARWGWGWPCRRRWRRFLRTERP